MAVIMSPPRWDFPLRAQELQISTSGRPTPRRWRSSAFQTGTARDNASSLDELAVVDEAMTVALVEFRFPDETRFPCLPVRTSNNRGLVHPLEGSSWATGPELVVAR